MGYFTSGHGVISGFTRANCSARDFFVTKQQRIFISSIVDSGMF